jgi:hypothetical protein
MIFRHEPESAYGHGFAMLLRDGRNSSFEVTDESWYDHTPDQIAGKMRDDRKRELQQEMEKIAEKEGLTLKEVIRVPIRKTDSGR